jgi:hypothetical protein
VCRIFSPFLFYLPILHAHLHELHPHSLCSISSFFSPPKFPKTSFFHSLQSNLFFFLVSSQSMCNDQSRGGCRANVESIAFSFLIYCLSVTGQQVTSYRWLKISAFAALLAVHYSRRDTAGCLPYTFLAATLPANWVSWAPSRKHKTISSAIYPLDPPWAVH